MLMPSEMASARMFDRLSSGDESTSQNNTFCEVNVFVRDLIAGIMSRIFAQPLPVKISTMARTFGSLK